VKRTADLLLLVSGVDSHR